MSKDSARDNPSYLRGIVHPHWEMPLDRELSQVPDFDEMKPRLFNLVADPAERHDLAGAHPELVADLVQSYDDWFDDVMIDWRESREAILEHDQNYWKDRPVPDPTLLFEEFWLWNRAPTGTDPRTANPLKVFRGYWRNSVGT
jgi:hypothetical protein